MKNHFIYTKGRELTCIERCQIERWHNVDKISNHQVK